MQIDLDPDLGRGYKNPSQRVKAITEGWGRENLYCVACDSDAVAAERPGRPVIDFTCEECSEHYQLKSRGYPFSGQVRDAAYRPLADAVVNGTVPNFLFLQYDPDAWRVENLQLVPRFFMSLSALAEQKPLGPSARRSGHILCNILLSQLPFDARIYIVRQVRVENKEIVRAQWTRFAFLKGKEHELRGWTANVLAEVRQLGKSTFSLKEFYEASQDRLSALHPENEHVRDKMRQQLQVLRDHGIVEFLGKGRYRQVRWCPECGHDFVPDALPRNGSGHRRLACPECGAWLWE
jgi:type II restriction enzyme